MSGAIWEGNPASTDSPILDVELGSLHSELRADSTSIARPASDTFSRLSASPKWPRYGETNLFRNESIVPIGASSNRVSSCSPNPESLILGSLLPVSSEPVGPGFNPAISFLSLSRISSAARLVKVNRTTSPGSRPPHSLRSILSEDGAVIMPPGSLAGRSGVGSILVALWSSVR